MDKHAILKRLLPDYIMEVLDRRLSQDRLYELRLRVDKPVCVNYGGKYYFLSKTGITSQANDAIICPSGLIKDVILRATDYSLYAVNNNICDGFITIEGGIRIGLAGESVYDNGSVKTVKNFHSVNIRIPHEEHCANKIIPLITQPDIMNTLIVSPPGAGKTTLLRDIARLLSDLRPMRNVLIADERMEIACVQNSGVSMNVGALSDVMSNCTKRYVFTQGLRSMRPDIIITDELGNADDLLAIEEAMYCGVKVIASAHARDIEDIRLRIAFKPLLNKIERYVVLSERVGVGTVEGVYDGSFGVIPIAIC